MKIVFESSHVERGYFAAKRYLWKSSIAADLFCCAENKIANVVTIKLLLGRDVTMLKGFEYDPETHTLWWDPCTGIIWQKGVASPAMVLCHELVHVCRHGTIPGTKPGELEEQIAVSTCNKVAKVVGEHLRPWRLYGQNFPIGWNGVAPPAKFDHNLLKDLPKKWLREEWK